MNLSKLFPVLAMAFSWGAFAQQNNDEKTVVYTAYCRSGGDLSRLWMGEDVLLSEGQQLIIPSKGNAHVKIVAVDHLGVAFDITFQGDTKRVRASSNLRAEAKFSLANDDSVEITINVGKARIAPFGKGVGFNEKWTIEAYRIEPNFSETEESLFNRKILETAPIRSADFNTLEEILTDPDMIEVGIGSDCFIPRHALRIQNEDSIYKLVICFECSKLIFSSERGGCRYAIRNSTQLIDFFRNYFPEDNNLSENRD